MSWPRQIALFATLLTVTTGRLGAQQRSPENPSTAPATSRAADEQAIKAASQAFANAFNSGNVQGVAALFTEEAEYVDEGSAPIHGRAALAKAYQEFFGKRKELKAESKTEAIRFLGSDTAIEEGTFTVTAKDSSPESSRFSTLHVRQNGKWLIALMKEWNIETTAKPSLESLSWLIGTWESDGPEAKARSTYEWAANKSFIKVQYSITPKVAGQQASSGTQVIGVDPAVGIIRAWLFASDGGIGESNWVFEENRWMIESIGTLANGEHTSAINILTRTGNDTFSWKSVGRSLAGATQPDVAAVTVKRVGGSSTPPQAAP